MRRHLSTLLINGLAAAVLAFALADAARLLGGSGETVQAVPNVQPGAGSRAAAPASYAAIVDAHLYGVPESEEETVAVDAALTTLDLRLLGVVNSTDRAQAKALIAVEDGPGRYFRVNQLISGTDARIRTIGADQVVIDRAGRLERVLLWSPENMARANQGAAPPPLPGVAVPAYPDLGAGSGRPAAALLLPGREGAARDTP